MASFNLRVNGQTHTLDVDPNMPLLWVLRDYLQLTGTKFSCGIAQCGSCTVHLDGKPNRSCLLPVSAAAKFEILTIEGLSADNDHPVQQAWIETQAPQCGFCQSGQIMAAAALLEQNKQPTDADIDRAMQGILCRCGTYPRIRQAIHRAAEIKAQGSDK